MMEVDQQPQAPRAGLPQQDQQQQQQQQQQQHHHHHQQQQQHHQQQKHHQQQQRGRQKPPDEEGAPNADKWWLSESEDDDGSSESQARSEDPLYDPNADAVDEAWADQRRGGRATDAILSCPSCFTTLCIDCQQHAQYHTQYRAVFTQNCEVKADQVMAAEVQRPSKQQQQRWQRKRRAGSDEAASQQQAAAAAAATEHRPVCCAVCGETVGAQDEDEVVHFFHVLASEC